MARAIILFLLPYIVYAQSITGGSYTAGNQLLNITTYTTGIVFSGTYTSGITTTGTVGQTCLLTVTNGGGSGATSTVALTGTNTIAGGTALVITAGGTGFTSAPTSASVAAGTATACSGTATIATVIYQPISVPGTYLTDFAGPLTYVLPTITTGAIGSLYCFRNAVTRTGVITVAAPAAGTFIDYAGANTASGGNITSGGAAGDFICLFPTTVTQYVSYARLGTWTKH